MQRSCGREEPSTHTAAGLELGKGERTEEVGGRQGLEEHPGEEMTRLKKPLMLAACLEVQSALLRQEVELAWEDSWRQEVKEECLVKKKEPSPKNQTGGAGFP